MSATQFTVHTDRVTFTASALICGDGIDLVIDRLGHRRFTLQISMDDAMCLAESIASAAVESEGLTL